MNALAERLLRHGLFIEDTTPAFHGTPHLNGFRVSYAYIPPAELRKALELVAKEAERLLARS